MNLCPFSVTVLLFSFTIIIFFFKLIHGSYIGDVAINCGYHGNTTALDGRQWFGDMDISSVLQPRGHSRSSIPRHKSIPADPIPYMTARTSATQFHYSFQVNPGQKFIRLHFYPSSSYQGFENSLDFFTVKAGPFTLFRNFSASFSAHAMGVNYIIKEFCVNIGENQFLNLTFNPAQSSKRKKYHAYVNGIEIISMPTGLYFTPDDDDLGALVIGQSNRYFHVDNSTALEMVQRLNIGGSSISPVEDFGMFRRWNADLNYLQGSSELQPVNHLVPWTNTGLYTFSAPPRIYHTSWQTAKNRRTDNANYNFTWKIPVDLGFGYLVRLHFCDLALVERTDKQMEFNILIDNQHLEADIIRLDAGNGAPIYRDYMVMMKGDEEDRYDLLLALQSTDELAIELLRGLEIFKLSNLENNLASKNEVYLQQVSTPSWNLKTKHFLSPFDRKNTIVTGITILLILLNLIVSRLRQNWEESSSCLTWEQRLSICIGAAHGLDYLHTGIEYEIIHRDVKDSNILLDKNLVAKISDFGLSKLRNTSESQGNNLSTKVKGTPGFVDPDYFMTHKPTTKTDVYAFGIVMLVVLCGRPAIDRSIPWEPRSLLSLFHEHVRKGDVNGIVDPSLQGKISTQSLKEFIKSLENCLHIEPRERPTMSQVATSLEWALEKQQGTMSGNAEEAPAASTASGQSRDDEFTESFRLSPIHEEGFSTTLTERIIGDVIDELQPPPPPQRGESKRTIFKKTFISSAMEAIWKKRKTSRKQDSSLEFPEYAHFPRFTLRQIREATGNFLVCLRKDSSWVEYRGYKLGGSEYVAVKYYRTESGDRICEELFFKQMMTHSKIKHINLVSILGYCIENQEMILIQEYMSRGTLTDNILNMDGYGEVGFPTPLTWEQRLRICIGAARGLDCLHNCGIVHRDVKCSNILLDENMVAKIANIELSRIFSYSESHISTLVCGTFGYLDPAYVITSRITKKSDVYSFGVVMLVVLCGRSPIINGNDDETRMTIVQYFLERGSDEDIVDQNMSQLVVSLENALEMQRYPSTTMSSASVSEDTLEEPPTATTLPESAFLTSLSGPF